MFNVMEKTSKVNKPVNLLGIKSMKEADGVEREIVQILDDLEEGVKEDSEAHKRLLELGEKISKKSGLDGKGVEEFLKERRSLS